MKQIIGAVGASLANFVLRYTRRRAGAALLYHTVAEREGDPERELVPPMAWGAFRRQLRHLLRHYNVVPVDRFLSAVESRRRGERFPVCITFDDDAPEHLQHAVPLMREYGVPATFFLCGASLNGRASSFWWQRVQRALDRGVSVREIVELLPDEVGVRLEGLNGDIHRLGEAIELLAPAQRDHVAEQLLTLAGEDPPGSSMSADAIVALSEAGFGVGFHTHRHDRLIPLSDADLDRALHEHREALASLIKGPLDVISYPHGRADRRVADAARQAGFRLGFTGKWEAATPHSDPLLLGRFEVCHAFLGDFAVGVVRTLLRDDESAGVTPQRAAAGAALVRRAARRYLASGLRWRLATRIRRLTAWPRVGYVRFGSFRRLSPISRSFGFDRGNPVDRYYIDEFFRRHAGPVGSWPGLIRGAVLEVGEDRYARRFSVNGAIHQMEILDVTPDNPNATLIADLADGRDLSSDAFDCVICTQVLLLIYDVSAAVRTLNRILKPGGTLFVTLPGISQICRPEMDVWGDYWRFTTLSARRLFEEVFAPADVTVESYGNVLSSAAFLYGLSAEDLKPKQLNVRDPDYQLLIGIKAVKAAA